MEWSVVFAVAGMLATPPAPAAPLDPAAVPLLKRSFAEGREYFVLRSGRAKLIAQADRFDVAPAFLYRVFDAEDNRQSARKDRAFNFGFELARRGFAHVLEHMVNPEGNAMIAGAFDGTLRLPPTFGGGTVVFHVR